MEAEDRGREPARWCMHWTEVGVFDDNAAAFGIDVSNLMEAAGQGLAAQAIRMLDSVDRRRGPIWILCGPGNNGGDGFAAALGLVEEGVDVRLLAPHLIQRGTAAQAYRERCSAANIPLSI